MNLEALELFAIDALVERARRDAIERDLALLATREGRHQARSRDPFAIETVRRVAGQSMFQSLRDLTDGASEQLHRDALLRWVHELCQARIHRELMLDEADAAHASEASRAGETERSPKDESSGHLASFEDARTALLSAPTPALADAAYRRMADLAAPVAAVRRELRARRFEVARRLGLTHPWALATPANMGELEALARSLLDATEPLARELEARRVRHAEPGVSLAAQTMFDAFGRQAREGWPARLTARWLEDVFHAVTPRTPRAASVPPVCGGASFLRAACAWGESVRYASIAQALPRALARDPYPTEAFVLGHAFGRAVAGVPFAKRKLGLSARAADAHARALEAVLFQTLRRYAGELLALLPETERASDVEELSARVFGAPFAPALASAWANGGLSGRRRVDLPARFVAAVRAHAFVTELVERFDEDWFNNPRACMQFASMGAGPIWSSEQPAEGATLRLARAFEERLG